MSRVLVAYATWAGATKEVAETIADTFQRNGLNAEVHDAGKIDAIDEYDGIILGTSIHATKPVHGFSKFLRRFNEKLSNKPIAFFTVCANMMEDCEENRTETLGWLHNATGKYPHLNPVSVGLFGGAVVTESKEYNSLFVLVRKIIDAMKKKMVEDYGKSDFRDWEKIRNWSEEIIPSYK